MDDYVIYSEIAQAGANGLVYKGRKSYVSAQRGSQAATKAHASRRCRWSPAIVPVLKWCNAQTEHWLVMDLCSGGDLETILQADGPLPTDLLREVAVDICVALQAAHCAGLVVGDVRPKKFLLDDGHLRLGSLSRVFSIDPPDEGEEIPALDGDSAKRLIEMVPFDAMPYMAPEVRKGLQLSPSSDMYALGCMLFVMATGRHPNADDLTNLTSSRFFRGTLPLVHLPEIESLQTTIQPPATRPSSDAPGQDLIMGDSSLRSSTATVVNEATDSLDQTYQTASSAKGPVFDSTSPSPSAAETRASHSIIADQSALRLSHEEGVGHSEPDDPGNDLEDEDGDSLDLNQSLRHTDEIPPEGVRLQNAPRGDFPTWRKVKWVLPNPKRPTHPPSSVLSFHRGLLKRSDGILDQLLKGNLWTYLSALNEDDPSLARLGQAGEEEPPPTDSDALKAYRLRAAASCLQQICTWARQTTLALASVYRALVGRKHASSQQAREIKERLTAITVLPVVFAHPLLHVELGHADLLPAVADLLAGALGLAQMQTTIEGISSADLSQLILLPTTLLETLLQQERVAELLRQPDGRQLLLNLLLQLSQFACLPAHSGAFGLAGLQLLAGMLFEYGTAWELNADQAAEGAQMTPLLTNALQGLQQSNPIPAICSRIAIQLLELWGTALWPMLEATHAVEQVVMAFQTGVTQAIEEAKATSANDPALFDKALQAALQAAILDANVDSVPTATLCAMVVRRNGSRLAQLSHVTRLPWRVAASLHAIAKVLAALLAGAHVPGLRQRLVLTFVTCSVLDRLHRILPSP
ncbi:uncharacterized protein MONBRDRAFT_8080 [Monosiga brevicollis MX1]|uniref:Protein kinase domain-containing protein n=1 Tax=Monosiga brevicollis TaxID=81824 RepID=A9UYZ8_MONBE|nr:uncharacterized protein MONBRDRAFT_8080 [Monosiga brevicollis MX1]EDQ89697.1 predicted protein [Monosiga brevicollis MX1]|eukprot:XP_001745726.1 hypothetical protein [Monosiga brevicollis MX1]